MTSRPKFVFLIDDDESMRRSLEHVLRESGYIVQGFASAHTFLDKTEQTSPAVIVLDMQMPDMNGIELQERLNAMARTTPIIFISGQSHPTQIVQGMRNGAVHFLFKPFGLKDLVQAIEEAMNKDIEQTKHLINNLSVVARYKSLTPRERDVCHWVAKGLQNVDIAQKFESSPNTVKIQKGRVMAKMQANSVAELALMYAEYGLEKIFSEEK
jgi:FixJ family two-component response regulator